MDEIKQLSKEVEGLKQQATLQSYKLSQLEEIGQQNVSGQTALISELHELTAGIRVMVQRQDHAKESAKRMWKEHEDLRNRVSDVEKWQSTNSDVVNGVKAINSKLVSVVVVALLATVVAPAATVTLVLSNLTAKQSHYEQKAESPERDPKQ